MNRIIIAITLVLASLICCAWAGGPEIQLSFDDIQGTVGVANGGTGRTSSSAALAALGGVGCASPSVVLKSTVVTGVTAAAEGGTTILPVSLTPTKIMCITAIVDGAFPPRFELTASERDYEVFYSPGEGIVVKLSDTNSGSILSKSVSVFVVYME